MPCQRERTRFVHGAFAIDAGTAVARATGLRPYGPIVNATKDPWIGRVTIPQIPRPDPGGAPRYPRWNFSMPW